MLRRVNKTENNLQTLWNHLDSASGELYNALDALARMSDIEQSVKLQAERIDIDSIDNLKNSIELIMTERGYKLKV